MSPQARSRQYSGALRQLQRPTLHLASRGLMRTVIRELAARPQP